MIDGPWFRYDKFWQDFIHWSGWLRNPKKKQLKTMVFTIPSFLFWLEKKHPMFWWFLFGFRWPIHRRSWVNEPMNFRGHLWSPSRRNGRVESLFFNCRGGFVALGYKLELQKWELDPKYNWGKISSLRGWGWRWVQQQISWGY